MVRGGGSSRLERALTPTPLRLAVAVVVLLVLLGLTAWRDLGEKGGGGSFSAVRAPLLLQ